MSADKEAIVLFRKMVDDLVHYHALIPAQDHVALVSDIMLHVPKLIAQHDAALKQKLLEALPKRDLFEPITKRKVAPINDLVRIDVDADLKGSLVFVQDNGYNQAIDKVLEAMQSVFKEVI